MKKNSCKYLGSALPLGATITNEGINFSIFSRNAKSVVLNFFKHEKDNIPSQSYTLDPIKNKTGDIWHIFIKGVSHGTLYLYQMDGQWDPDNGLLYDKNNYLIDPYTKALTDNFIWDLHGNGTMPKSIAICHGDFNWEDDKPLNIPMKNSVIYEAHVAGLTKNGNFKYPGTYMGVLELIPYFKDLGITTIEFLPIFAFDSFEGSRKHPKTGKTLENYWGYSTSAFFAPKGMYAHNNSGGNQVTEFKQMVKELHKNGIEVVLDVVFNHTGEGNQDGPIYSFKGIENSLYYMLERDKRNYKNYSGCGNTFNCNNPIVSDFIIDCLRYWVTEMHVDGFRFDLASILARDENGQLNENATIIRRIGDDPVLRNTKLIAEPWDAAGAHQTGNFSNQRWAEWNDRYRDDIRQFWRGDSSYFKRAATRIAGSSDMFSHSNKKPFHSINFITAHDGFTLMDLMSYSNKNNFDNGEDNRDGSNNNLSHNCGIEGYTDDPIVTKLRVKQIKNHLATLLISQGTPMILGGDEIGRTKGGNNNTYCQNNEISWFDWKNSNEEILRFTKIMINFRKRHPAFQRPDFYTGLDISNNSLADITWYTYTGHEMNWNEEHKCLAFIIDGSRKEIAAEKDDNDFYVMLNSTSQKMQFVFSNAPKNKKWVVKIDTANNSPLDIYPKGEFGDLPTQTSYTVDAKSLVLLESIPIEDGNK
ncbi:glycogen debranching enzyme GlgX [Thiospirochaeta perfilievii]|uniref:Glycogen debranching enzyme GlgX n=1 Tax=Thiospirochaeta perfilievii TaxID=252967 RepID=A0A5C1QHH2_9SPIO|nr:glycogen debranching protein GlgX [Thiospirochaeta perfilievii]QEN06016.1 glycogen debranching enzyme GlgX [Thiospirochaeta perfilievii]